MKILFELTSILVFVAVASLLAGCNGHKTVEDTPKESATNTTKVAHSDAALLDTIQRQTFDYFWEGAEPTSGLARERIHLDKIYPTHDKDIITTGGSGFGLMAILVGVERGFITREQALQRYEKVIEFLAKADRFHGAWPHWLKPDGTVILLAKKMMEGI